MCLPKQKKSRDARILKKKLKLQFQRLIFEISNSKNENEIQTESFEDDRKTFELAKKVTLTKFLNGPIK